VGEWGGGKGLSLGESGKRGGGRAEGDKEECGVGRKGGGGWGRGMKRGEGGVSVRKGGEGWGWMGMLSGEM